MTDENESLTKSSEGGIIEEVILTKPQRAFLEYCAKFGWGKLEVTIKNGEPVMVSPIKQDIKLD